MRKLTDKALAEIKTFVQTAVDADKEYRQYPKLSQLELRVLDDTRFISPSVARDLLVELLDHIDAQNDDLARLRGALEKIADLPGQVTDLDGTAYAAGVREAAAIARRALEELN